MMDQVLVSWSCTRLGGSQRVSLFTRYPEFPDGHFVKQHEEFIQTKSRAGTKSKKG